MPPERVKLRGKVVKLGEGEGQAVKTGGGGQNEVGGKMKLGVMYIYEEGK